MLPEWVALQAGAVDKVWVPRNGLPQGSFELKLLFNIVEGSLPRGSVTRPVRARSLQDKGDQVAVFVLDKRKKPLMPCSEKRARKLLRSGRARVHRLIPFAIRLVDVDVANCALQPVRIKIDPGSKFTGIVNSTRWAMHQRLKATGLPVTTGSGGLTKYNRARLGIPKSHALDAACVGQIDVIQNWQQPVLSIKATGRGRYQRTFLTKYGFPRGYLMRSKSAFGFQTGDRVKAVVTTGKKAGTYLGRVAIRASGSFSIQTATGLVQGVHHRFCTLNQRADGYGYFKSLSSNLGKLVLNSPKTVSHRRSK